MDNVDVSKSATYRIHVQQRTETEMGGGTSKETLRGNIKYRTHDAMHPSCTVLVIG